MIPVTRGPLAGVALKIPVYHVLEEEVLAVVPEKLREEKLQLSSLVIDVEPMREASTGGQGQALTPFRVALRAVSSSRFRSSESESETWNP